MKENRDAANNAASLQLAVEGIKTQVLQQEQQRHAVRAAGDGQSDPAFARFEFM